MFHPGKSPGGLEARLAGAGEGGLTVPVWNYPGGLRESVHHLPGGEEGPSALLFEGHLGGPDQQPF